MAFISHGTTNISLLLNWRKDYRLQLENVCKTLRKMYKTIKKETYFGAPNEMFCTRQKWSYYLGLLIEDDWHSATPTNVGEKDLIVAFIIRQTNSICTTNISSLLHWRNDYALHPKNVAQTLRKCMELYKSEEAVVELLMIMFRSTKRSYYRSLYWTWLR